MALKRPFVGLGYGHSSPPALGYQSRIKGRPTSFGGGRVTDALSPPQGPLGEHQGISVLSRLSTLRWNCLVCIMKHSSALLLRTLGCPRKRLDVAETLWLPLIPLLLIRPSGSGWNRETVVWIYEGCKSSNKCKNSNISFSACSPCVLWAFSEWYLSGILSDLWVIFQ